MLQQVQLRGVALPYDILSTATCALVWLACSIKKLVAVEGRAA